MRLSCDGGMVALSPSRSGALLTVGSMTCVQLGLAASVEMLRSLDATSLAVLRLGWAGLLLLLLVRPRPWRLPPRDVGACLALGVVTALMTLTFLVAVSRLPLATASALEFLGPLGVAAARARSWSTRVLWPAAAAVGVLLLTRPWTGAADLVGVCAALAAAVCWAAYIVLTQRVGATVSGLSGLAMSLPVAGLVAAMLATLVTGPGALAFAPRELLLGLGLAVLLPLVPFSLELVALRRMEAAAFGVLMCWEPAIALVLGAVVLDQTVPPVAVAGLLCVVVAGVGAERGAAPRPLQPGAGRAGNEEVESDEDQGVRGL
jgi:inner membrane transporter RhtA